LGGDSISERELKALLGSAPTPHMLAPRELEKPVSTKPLFSHVYAEFLEHKINKDK
jgi:hypothetical protein